MIHRLLVPIIALVVCIASASGQGADVKYKAEISGIEVNTTKSPDFEVGSGVIKKKEDRRDWLEIDVAFKVASTDRDDFVGSVQVKFFVLPKGADKRFLKLYTATINHVDLIKDTELRSSVYLTPNALARLYGVGKTPNPRDIWVAVEIHAGELIGGDVTDGKASKWWQRDDVPTDEGMLRPKSKTPFAYLWYDAYAETRD